MYMVRVYGQWRNRAIWWNKLEITRLYSYIDCVMVIGSEKGYVYPFDIMTDPKKKKVRSELIMSMHHLKSFLFNLYVLDL